MILRHLSLALLCLVLSTFKLSSQPDTLFLSVTNPQVSCPLNVMTFDVMCSKNTTGSPIILTNVLIRFLFSSDDLADFYIETAPGSSGSVTTFYNDTLENSSPGLLGLNQDLVYLEGVYSGVEILDDNQVIQLLRIEAHPRGYLNEENKTSIILDEDPNGNSINMYLPDSLNDNGIVAVSTTSISIPVVVDHFNWEWQQNSAPYGDDDGIIIPANCNCVSDLYLKNTPTPSDYNRAKYTITAENKITSPTKADYAAGQNVILEPGFCVEQNAELLVDIEDCDMDCAATEPCDDDPCPHPAYELDSLGNKFVPNQVVMTLPDSIPPFNADEANIIKTYMDSFYIAATGYDSLSFVAASTLERCLCDRNIFLYSVDESFPIDAEGCCNNSGKPREEGDVKYSLNHYVDSDKNGTENLPEDNVFPGRLNLLPNAIRVAFLDSGIESRSIPTETIYGSSGLDNDICTPPNAIDQWGWNFIDNNSDVTDYNGHGTMSYFSYLSALNKLGLPNNSQATINVKVLDDCGVGTIYSTTCGLYYAVDKEAQVINTSWGMYVNNKQLERVISEITADGTVFISTSAGNSGLELDTIPHFPSGYAYPYFSLDKEAMVAANDNVFEVAGLCMPIQDICNENINYSLWRGSNYRENQIIFAEPSIEIQSAFNDLNNFTSIDKFCGITGTSYSAPQMTASLVHKIIELDNTNNPNPLSKAMMLADSKEYSEYGLTYYSYIHNNVTCISN